MRNRSIALFVRKDKVLSLQTHRDGGYVNELPGGGTESGEAPKEAALKDLKEEGGLAGSINSPLNILHWKEGSTEYAYLIDVSPEQKESIGFDPEVPADEEQAIKNARWLK